MKVVNLLKNILKKIKRKLLEKIQPVKLKRPLVFKLPARLVSLVKNASLKKRLKRFGLLFLVGLLAFLQLAIVVSEVLYVKNKTDKAVHQEQIEHAREVQALAKEIDRRISGLEFLYNAVKLSNTKKITLDDKRVMLDELRILEEESLALYDVYVNYRSDITIEHYPNRLEQADKVVIGAAAMHVAVDRMIRDMEYLIYSGSTKKDLIQLMQESIWNVRWHVNNLNSVQFE
jgi:hypothetical protein